MNSVEIKSINSGNVISRKSSSHFSNERLLVADFVVAEKFLREVIGELLMNKNKVLKQSIAVVLQINCSEIKVATSVEKRIYQDMAEHAGAAKYWFVEHQNKLSDDEVIKISN